MKGNASFLFNRVAAARTQLQRTDAMIIPTEYEQRQRQRFMFVNPWISSHSTLSRRWKLRKVKSEATRRIHKAKRNEIRTRSDVSYSLTTWSTRKRTRRRKSVPKKNWADDVIWMKNDSSSYSAAHSNVSHCKCIRCLPIINFINQLWPIFPGLTLRRRDCNSMIYAPFFEQEFWK